MIGKTISQYVVVERPGEGEIGVMHKAEGMRLKPEATDEDLRHRC